MEVLNTSMFFQPRISPAVPFNACSPWVAISNSCKSRQCLPFRTYLACSIPFRKFRISAHIGRGKTRPNYLRGKLAHRLRRAPVENPVSDSVGVDLTELTSDGSISDRVSQNFVESSDSNYESNASDPINFMRPSPKESVRKKAGESALWNKLESWVEQYKKDTEFWGTGSGPIFIIYEGSESKIERVVVNEDEIRRRNRGTEDLDETGFKISLAHDMASAMENNMKVIPKNSSVAKFLVSGKESRLTEYKSQMVEMIQSISSRPDSFKRMSVAAVLVLCGMLVVRAAGVFITEAMSNKELTKLEKEMLRRKQRSRNEKGKMLRGSVEVMQDLVEPKSVHFKRPSLDKEELAKNIIKASVSNNELAAVGKNAQKDRDLKDKIEEISMMARHAREVEKRDSSLSDRDGNGTQTLKDVSENVKPENKLDNASQFTTEVFLNKSSNEKPLMQSSASTEVSPLDNSGGLSTQQKSISRKKLRIINSAEEAREYLSKKLRNPKVNKEPETISDDQNDVSADLPAAKVASCSTNHMPADEMPVSMGLGVTHEPVHPFGDESVDVEAAESSNSLNDSKKPRQILTSRVKVSGKDTELPKLEGSLPKEVNIRAGKDTTSAKTLSVGASSKDNSRDWIEKNFHEFEPIINKIGVGFTENYQIAREKSSLDLVLEMEKSDASADELEWMKDEHLRDIVFQVRDNELSGRDPFHLMTEEQKSAFFCGLDRRAEAENKKLLHLHEYLHSNIENLDYGADGISLYDPPEKIIPRWKVPPAERNLEISTLRDERKDLSLETSTEKTGIDIPQKAAQTSPKTSRKSASSKIVIQGSDGSVKPGKKSGKEYWQHTKKRSQGFMESYNAESDPEVKAVMKDIGKDLDRWITEKEVKEAAELTDKLPAKGRDFLKKKLDKVQREMQLFGPQAVVSKYREYAEDKEEDYLWWLDLPYVLCIELYTMEADEQKTGLYSLEMGADLELDPKQYHVIAFQDAGDCKNLCYIIQAHMEMLGNGHAFVIARPPKDAFREAKANGFSVTVVRKGQLQMDVDKTLEEVEESLVEIGSKIYNDKITRERSVDINSVMKGVFGFNLPAQRKRLKKKLRRRQIKR